MNDQQYTRYKSMLNSKISLIYKMFDKQNLHFLVEGSSAKYKVSLYKKGFVTCNCPDFKSRSKKDQIVCKHVLYILMNYLRLITNLEHPFFKRRSLTPQEFEFSRRVFERRV